MTNLSKQKIALNSATVINGGLRWYVFKFNGCILKARQRGPLVIVLERADKVLRIRVKVKKVLGGVICANKASFRAAVRQYLVFGEGLEPLYKELNLANLQHLRQALPIEKSGRNRKYKIDSIRRGIRLLEKSLRKWEP